MAAAKGNKYAEKWTLEATVAKLEEMVNVLKNNPAICFVGTLCAETDVWRDLITYLAEKFEEEEKVYRTIKKINAILESRLVERGIKGENNATMTIFTLKNNYGWSDRTEVDVTSQGESINDARAELTKRLIKD